MGTVQAYICLNSEQVDTLFISMGGQEGGFWGWVVNLGRGPKIYQRKLSGQKPKHAPFCMKGATTQTSLHQIGPNLASN
jgi:hypothetical protein